MTTVIPYELVDKELGTTMIDEILITSGGVNLANYSGEYLSAVAQVIQREKEKLWDKNDRKCKRGIRSYKC